MEIPDRVGFYVNITNCQHKCPNCHSPHLRENIGDELTEDYIVEKFEKQLKLCNCFIFMGEGNDLPRLLELNKFIKNSYKIETALYSGRTEVENELYGNFDFIKIGPYIEKYGAINSKTTNQKLYYKGVDITFKLQNKIWEKFI
jgi:anaerobic ribonucleoside-triphosphate reductase activating protein